MCYPNETPDKDSLGSVEIEEDTPNFVKIKKESPRTGMANLWHACQNRHANIN